MLVRAVALVIGILALVGVAAGCGATPLEELADRTCSQLEEAAPEQMPGLFDGAVLQADELGADPQDLMSELFRECPETMSAIVSITDKQSSGVPTPRIEIEKVPVR